MRLRSSLRIREKNKVHSLTLKNDHFGENDEWIFSDEIETNVENGDTMFSILQELGFKELVSIESIKYIYHSNKHELVIEEVKDLGNFIEIEYINSTEVGQEEVQNVKNDIRLLIHFLGLSVGRELNAGKPELMLKKRLSTKDNRTHT